MHKQDLITYWLQSSDRDFQTMHHLVEKGDYTWSLFMGHLVLEKLLKAWHVQHSDSAPPFIHDLVRLAEKGDLPLDEGQKDLLDTISTFNIQARYDDYKMEFYKKCSKDFTVKWIDIIKDFRAWLKEKLQTQP